MNSINDMYKVDRLKAPDTGRLYDVAVVGGGPAGMTAAVYLLRKGLDTAMLTFDVGGQVLETSAVENYMGFRMIEGPELASKFYENVSEFELAFKQSLYIDDIKTYENGFKLFSEGSLELNTRSVIIAAGKKYRLLDIKGEKEFTGRGVAYCTTCDAPFFRGKTVTVIGGGNSGVESALELSKIAGSVLLIQNMPDLSADYSLQKKLYELENVKVMCGAEAYEISGDEVVRSIFYRKDGDSFEKKTDGVFVEIGMMPNSSFLKDFLELNETGEIIVDASCRTSVKGIFAAGDITSVPEKQIIVAAGEGAKASLSAYRYIKSLNNPH